MNQTKGRREQERTTFRMTNSLRCSKPCAMARFPLNGPLTRFGLAVALLTAVVDQASKLYLLLVVDLPSRGTVHVRPFLDLVLTKNTGISYGLLQSRGALGQWLL